MIVRCETWISQAETLIHSTSPIENEKELVDSYLAESMNLPIHV